MEKEKRLIDADALYTEVTEKYRDIVAGAYPFNIVAYDMAKLVENAPTVDAVEVVHGRWEKYQVPPIMLCSECDWGTGLQSDFNYCPNCGAKMDGDRHDS